MRSNRQGLILACWSFLGPFQHCWGCLDSNSGSLHSRICHNQGSQPQVQTQDARHLTAVVLGLCCSWRARQQDSFLTAVTCLDYFREVSHCIRTPDQPPTWTGRTATPVLWAKAGLSWAQHRGNAKAPRLSWGCAACSGVRLGPACPRSRPPQGPCLLHLAWTSA